MMMRSSTLFMRQALRQKCRYASTHVFEVTEKDFVDKVMKSKTPVILDCYADWCEPCKRLGPALEAEVNKHNGKVVMAKLNVDLNRNLQSSLQVTQLPTVLAVFQGKLTDKFIGEQKQPILQQFVSKAVALNTAVDTATEVETIFEQVCANVVDDKANEDILEVMKNLIAFELPADMSKEDAARIIKVQAKTLALEIKILIASGEVEKAQNVCDTLVKNFPQLVGDAGISSVIATVKLMMKLDPEAIKQMQDLEGKAELTSAQRLSVASALFAKGKQGEAIENALTILKTDLTMRDEAKEVLLEFFQALGNDHELTRVGRRRMTSLLLV